MIRLIQFQTWKKILLVSLSLFIFNGCKVIDLANDLKLIEVSGMAYGKVDSRHAGDAETIVMAVHDVDGKVTVANYTMLSVSSDDYVLVLKTGVYRLYAFEDQNANLRYDAGEPAGRSDIPSGLIIKNKLGVEVPSILLSNTFILPFSFDGTEFYDADAKRADIAVGDIANLSDERFSREMGEKGIWSPISFLAQAGVGVYFLEEYDPNKIPILFVNGAAGSPEDWHYFFENIDRDKYQPWFFHYPSGFRLGKLANVLTGIVWDLHEKHQFKSLYVTAHSMGGLISRKFILNTAARRGADYIKLFVSISTPWGGHQGAAMGLKQSPLVIPSWNDLDPDSLFIESIYNYSLKKDMNNFLFFSIKGNGNIFQSNNDGAVTLESQLDYRAQKDAVRLFGFNVGHMGVLSSEDVMKTYNGLLDAQTN